VAYYNNYDNILVTPSVSNPSGCAAGTYQSTPMLLSLPVIINSAITTTGHCNSNASLSAKVENTIASRQVIGIARPTLWYGNTNVPGGSLVPLTSCSKPYPILFTSPHNQIGLTKQRVCHHQPGRQHKSEIKFLLKSVMKMARKSESHLILILLQFPLVPSLRPPGGNSSE